MADGPLNIEVASDPATCRASATAMHELSAGIGGLGDTFGGVSGRSGFWGGQAGETFRGIVNNARGNCDHVERTAQQLSQGLTVFADEIDTVKSRMAQASQVASTAGLQVTEGMIHPPGPAPGPAPGTPAPNAPPEQAQQHQQAAADHQAAEADHQRKVRAFNEASATVNDARGKERAAIDKLNGLAGQSNDSTSSLTTAARTTLTTSVSLVGGLSAASNTLLKSADKSMHLATLATALRTSPNLTTQEQSQLADAQRKLYTQAAKDGFQEGQLSKVIGKLPNSVKTALSTNLSDVVNAMKNSGTGLPKSLMDDIGGLKRLPVVGTGLTAVLAGVDIANGADPVKTSEKAAGGLAAGAGLSALADFGVTAAIGAGLAVPGPGWVAAGVALGGAAAAYGISEFVDAHGDDINNAVGDAIGSIF